MGQSGQTDCSHFTPKNAVHSLRNSDCAPDHVDLRSDSTLAPLNDHVSYQGGQVAFLIFCNEKASLDQSGQMAFLNFRHEKPPWTKVAKPLSWILIVTSPPWTIVAKSLFRILIVTKASLDHSGQVAFPNFDLDKGLLGP